MAQRLSDKKVVSREDLAMVLPEDMPTEPDRFLRKKTAGDAARKPEERQEKPRRSLAAASPKAEGRKPRLRGARDKLPSKAICRLFVSARSTGEPSLIITW
jgi:hypothetical protein